MATIRYSLRSKTQNSKIQLAFSISRTVRLRVSTELTINYIDWSDATGLPKQNRVENKQLTSKLKKLSTHIIDKYNEGFTEGVIFTNKWLKERMDEFFGRVDITCDDSIFLNYIRDYIEYKELLPTTNISTLRKIRNLYDKFREFEEKNNKIYFIKDIDGRTLGKFQSFLLKDCLLMETTSCRYIKDLKTVLYDARSNGKIIHFQIDSFRVGSTNTKHKVVLSFDELRKIGDYKTLNRHWALACDWLIIGCYVGQRVSDLFRMKRSMITTKIDRNGETYDCIELQQLKTGEKVIIPIFYEVKKILSKYKGEFPPLFTNNAGSNATMFNRYIKQVCEELGFVEEEMGRVYDEELKKNVNTISEKYKLVCSHTCRRSFATNFYGDKRFSLGELVSITGHKSESQFLNYINKSSDEWAIQTAKTFKEMEVEDQKLHRII